MVPLLIMAYGQSNADRYISKPRLDSELLSNMSVITLTSGLGVRGRAYAPNGRLHKNRIAEFTIDGKRVADEGAPRVLPATYHEAKGTALLLSAGAVASALTNAPLTGVRAASKGGLRFVSLPDREGVSGIYRLADGSISPIVTGLVEDAVELADHLAAQTGARPDRCDILFLHGEADRSTPAEAYVAQFREARAEITQRLAEQGLTPRWILTQPAGTSPRGDGNAWQSRRGILMALADDPTLIFAGPLYPYPLADHIHYGAEGKALIGELCGRIIAQLDAGEPWLTPMPTGWRLEGGLLHVDFDTPEPLRIDADARAIGAHGFHVPSGVGIAGAEVSSDSTVTITLDETPAKPFTLNYAFYRNQKGDPPEGPPFYPVGGGALRTEWGEPSMLVPGRTLHKWVPGFSMAVDPAQGAGRFVA